MSIVRVDKSQLKIGMFVEAIEGLALENPQLGRRFPIKDQRQIEQLQNSKMSGAFINTTLGVAASSGLAFGRSEATDSLSEKAANKVAKRIQGQSRQTRDLMKGIVDGREITVGTFDSIIDDIADAVQNNPSLYIALTRLRAKDEVTFTHSLAVAALLFHFGQAMRMDPKTVRLLSISGLVHDVGKLSISRIILQKQGPLTPRERLVIENHPILSEQLLLRQTSLPEIVLEICRHHHERLDGKGYPDKLAAEAISVPVRMSSICDVYDALTSTRPYKHGWPSQQALGWMLERPEQFDQSLLWKFILCLDTSLTKGVIP